MSSRFLILLLSLLLTLLALHFLRLDVILPEWYKANPTPKKVMLKPTVAAKKLTESPTPTINTKKIVKKNN